MNAKTKTIFYLARMHEYTSDILEICKKYHNNYDIITTELVSKHAINMCIVQLGEHANQIKRTDTALYSSTCLHQVKGMRDRIVHSYGNIDYHIVREVLKDGIPELHKMIERMVPGSLMNNPYILYEIEFEDYKDNDEQ